MSFGASGRASLALILLMASIGCANGSPPRPSREAKASQHGWALLYGLLDQERQVSNLLIIKEERDAFEAVIDDISEVCGDAYDRLGELAKEQPRLDLSDSGLPADEVLTRQAIASTRRDQLLAANGSELELQLLLAQNEALTYAAQLADTLSRSEENPDRLAFVRALWKDLTRLQPQVQALLRHPVRSAR